MTREEISLPEWNLPERAAEKLRYPLKEGRKEGGRVERRKDGRRDRGREL